MQAILMDSICILHIYYILYSFYVTNSSRKRVKHLRGGEVEGTQDELQGSEEGGRNDATQ